MKSALRTYQPMILLMIAMALTACDRTAVRFDDLQSASKAQIERPTGDTGVPDETDPPDICPSDDELGDVAVTGALDAGEYRAISGAVPGANNEWVDPTAGRVKPPTPPDPSPNPNPNPTPPVHCRPVAKEPPGRPIPGSEMGICLVKDISLALGEGLVMSSYLGEISEVDCMKIGREDTAGLRGHNGQVHVYFLTKEELMEIGVTGQMISEEGLTNQQAYLRLIQMILDHGTAARVY